MYLILVIILTLMLAGAFYPYGGRPHWGYAPAGGIGLVLLILILLLVFGVFRWDYWPGTAAPPPPHRGPVIVP